VLCDGGDRYRSRLYDHDWLQGRGLLQPQPPAPRPEGVVLPR
jgi:cysteine synthase A